MCAMQMLLLASTSNVVAPKEPRVFPSFKRGSSKETFCRKNCIELLDLFERVTLSLTLG